MTEAGRAARRTCRKGAAPRPGPRMVARRPAGVARLAFQPVPEDRAGKNRLHLDLAVDDLAAAAEEAVALGATRVGSEVRDDQGSFQAMRDPEGNEFCLVSP